MNYNVILQKNEAFIYGVVVIEGVQGTAEYLKQQIKEKRYDAPDKNKIKPNKPQIDSKSRYDDIDMPNIGSIRGEVFNEAPIGFSFTNELYSDDSNVIPFYAIIKFAFDINNIAQKVKVSRNLNLKIIKSKIIATIKSECINFDTTLSTDKTILGFEASPMSGGYEPDVVNVESTDAIIVAVDLLSAIPEHPPNTDKQQPADIPIPNTTLNPTPIPIPNLNPTPIPTPIPTPTESYPHIENIETIAPTTTMAPSQRRSMRHPPPPPPPIPSVHSQSTTPQLFSDRQDDTSVLSEPFPQKVNMQQKTLPPSIPATQNPSDIFNLLSTAISILPMPIKKYDDTVLELYDIYTGPLEKIGDENPMRKPTKFNQNQTANNRILSNPNVSPNSDSNIMNVPVSTPTPGVPNSNPILSTQIPDHISTNTIQDGDMLSAIKGNQVNNIANAIGTVSASSDKHDIGNLLSIANNILTNMNSINIAAMQPSATPNDSSLNEDKLSNVTSINNNGVSLSTARSILPTDHDRIITKNIDDVSELLSAAISLLPTETDTMITKNVDDDVSGLLFTAISLLPADAAPLAIHVASVPIQAQNVALLQSEPANELKPDSSAGHVATNQYRATDTLHDCKDEPMSFIWDDPTSDASNNIVKPQEWRLNINTPVTNQQLNK